MVNSDAIAKNKGFAYVQYFHKDSVSKAVSLFDQKPFSSSSTSTSDKNKMDGETNGLLSVSPCQSKEERSTIHASQATLHVTNLSYNTSSESIE